MAQQVTLSTFLAIIDQMATTEELGSYAETLRGPRTRGSTTDFGLEDLPRDLLARRIEHPEVMEGCSAYRLQLPEGLIGRLGALPASELPEGSEIQEREGAHGPEKFLDVPESESDLPEVNFITIITGKADTLSGRAVFTWHPGLPLNPAKAVKLHNG